MYVHKFTSGDISLFAFGGTARPSFESPITASAWVGKAQLNNANVVKAIEDIKGASFGKEEKPEAEAPKAAPAAVPSAAPAMVKANLVPLADHFRYMAQTLSK